MEILLGFLSADGNTGAGNDLKRVELVFPTDGSTNAECDKLKQVTLLSRNCMLEYFHVTSA
jgi:hypothetical protein